MDEPNLVLEHLKAIRADVVAMRADLRDVKLRLNALERNIAGARRDGVDLLESHAHQQSSIDRLTERIDRIERRLELEP